MKKYKIAFYHTDFGAGGVEKVMITYANQLAELGFEVYAIETRQGILDNQFSAKVKVINLNVARFRYAILKSALAFKKYKIDLVFCANINTLYVEVAKLLCNHRMKIVTSHHFYCNNSEMKWYLVSGLKYIYNQSDFVLAVSEGIEKELLYKIGVKEKKVKVLKNPININELLVKSNEVEVNNIPTKSIMWCGRFTSVKNIPLLIDAYARIRLKYPEYILYLIGDGQDKDKIGDYVREKGLSEYVVFTGMLANPFSYLKKASVICLSSESEAYPTILLESLSFGKTIVSTPTKGAVEILENGRLGYLSVDFSVEEYSKALRKGIEEPMDESFLRKEVQKSNVDVVTNNLIKIFNQVMK